MAERAYQIAEASILDTFDNFGCQPKEIPEKLKPESFLANIFYFRICSYTEQIALINYLEQFLVEHKDVSTVINSLIFAHVFFFNLMQTSCLHNFF